MDSVPLHFSSRLWDLDFQIKCKITFIWKEDFGPLSNSPVIFSLAPVKCFWRCLFQKGLVSSFPEDVWAWRLLMHWLQLQFTPCEALPSVWIGLAWQYSQACGHPCCLCTFSYLIFSFNFVSNMLWYSTPWTAAPFSNDPLWLTLCGGCQLSSSGPLPSQQCSPLLLFQRTRDTQIYTVWMLIYWNSNWDTDFWLSLAARSNHVNENKKSLKCFTLHVMNLKYRKVSLLK